VHVLLDTFTTKVTAFHSVCIASNYLGQAQDAFREVF